MRYPRFLSEQGTIGFVAPSFGCATEPYRTAFNHALQVFRDMGYHICLGPNCYEDRGIGISNVPAECGRELNEMYCGSSSDILISCGGGELMCEVIPYMDFERIAKAKAKWYMGYSDNTNFTYLLATLCDTASIYGPCASTFGMEPWHTSLQDAFDLLCGKKKSVQDYAMWEREGGRDEEHPLAPYNLTEPVNIRRYICKEGVAHRLEDEEREIQLRGRLLGGCMDCLVNLLGTEYDRTQQFADRYAEDGIIWFLEACELNVMSIRRAIWQMKHAGWFSHVKGFLIGRPLCYGQEMFGIDHYRAVTDLLAEYDVPVLMDLDIGHFAPMMPLVCGGSADIAATGKGVQITYTWK